MTVVDTVAVDLSALAQAATTRAAGILYGLTEDGADPPEAFLTGMGLRFVRAGGAQLDTPGGWVAGGYERRWRSTLAQCRRTVSLGATFILLVHDLYGADGSAIDQWPGDGGDWSTFDAFLDRLIGDVRATGMAPQWDLWNEPDLAMFWGRSQTQYLETWHRAYRRVRAAFPDVTIVGPSTAGEPDTTDPWWNAFVDHVAANDVTPDVLSWHEIGGTAHGQDAVASRDAAERLLGGRGLDVSSFQVNEYAEPEQQHPGQSAWFIARLERAGVDGLRANWGRGGGLHDDLAALLVHTDGRYLPLPDWFTYSRYATQRGAIALTRPGVAVDLFATLGDGAEGARLLVGNHGAVTGPARIEVSGWRSQGHGRTCRVAIERIGWNEGQPSDGPVAVSDSVIATRSDTLALDLDYADARDAFFIAIRPGP